MPMDPRLTALTTAAKSGLKKRKLNRPTDQVTQRPVPLSSAATAPAPQQPSTPPVATQSSTISTAPPTGSAPALGMLSSQLAQGTMRKRKRTSLQPFDQLGT